MTVRAPRPGAGMGRPALSLFNDVSAGTRTFRRETYVDVEVKVMILRMGAPSSKLMTICTPVPCDSMNCHVVISQE